MLSSRQPPEIKRAVEADPRSNQEVIEDALRRHLGTDKTAILEMRLDHRQCEREMLARERDELNQRIQQLDEEIEYIERQISDLKSTQAKYDTEIDEILDSMADSGTSVFVGHGRIRRLAERKSLEQQTVIADLKERAEQRGLDIPEAQFEDGYNGGEPS